MKQISILGCGWLGLPLAKSLLENGFSVNGSTTSSEKIAILKSNGIQPFLIELSEDGIIGKIDSFLTNSDVLIIDIPPKLRRASNENFVKKIKLLIPFIKKSKLKKVVFVSSTSVYADSGSVITETTKPNPDTESGKQLVESEDLLLNNVNFKTTVVRFGGLIGEDRHPVRFLAGRQDIENPDAFVNLIHQTDCIGIIERIIELDSWKHIFNAVAPFHPSRKEYYTQKAMELGLPLPEFKESQNSFGKIIESDMISTELKYIFKNPKL